MTRASLLLVLASLATPAVASAGDAAVLSTTRELAKQGLEAYDAGRFDEAVAKLTKAYSVVHVPTLAVATARALAKTGKLVAASELYLEATKMQQESSWQPSQLVAQRDADTERAQLLKRIARLDISIVGAAAKDIGARVDGIAVPQALVDAEQMMDPGERNVEGRCGSEVVNRSIILKEGEHARVELPFTPGCAIASPTTSKAQLERNSASPTTSAIPETTTAAHRHGRTQKILGWTTLSVGGVGLAVGATSGILAMAKRSSITDVYTCGGSDQVSCPKGAANDIDSYNVMRTVSTVGFVAGGVLAAAGVALLLTAPKQEVAPSAAIWVSPNSIGIFGGF